MHNKNKQTNKHTHTHTHTTNDIRTGAVEFAELRAEIRDAIVIRKQSDLSALVAFQKFDRINNKTKQQRLLLLASARLRFPDTNRAVVDDICPAQQQNNRHSKTIKQISSFGCQTKNKKKKKKNKRYLILIVPPSLVNWNLDYWLFC
jgi:hypothetical protein